jgi:hypothetical protein
MDGSMSDRNLQLQPKSLADRSKAILAGRPLANWSDNLTQLHADFLARIAELERETETYQAKYLAGIGAIEELKGQSCKQE